VFFNLVLPSPFLGNFSYIHLGPFFTFFIVLSVAYGVAKYQLMSIKALLAEILIIGLILIQLIQVVIAKDFANVVISTAVLGAVLVIGFLLVRSVLNEVKRREEVSTLATSLKRANYRLKELDRQKTEFLSIASHQLRTPLSITKGYIELLQDGAFGKITSKTYNTLNEMDQSNERLVKLIDEFLDITRIEQGRTKYSFVDADMNNLISSVTSELDKRAKNTGISLIWKPRKNLNKVHMDEEKIRHVVFNFVDNAIKYSDKSKKGSVEVSVEKEKKGLSVRVVDNGLGFTRTDKENFFQKFYRGKNVQDLNINGTGLGLYVCRKFIETHKGNVWAKSAGRNKGSEFGFWVPIGKKS